jgi:hypothetical protein
MSGMHQPVVSPWEADCERWRGRVLTGEFAHWCYEWDSLPVDETTEEFACCSCDFESEQDAKEQARARVKARVNSE